MYTLFAAAISLFALQVHGYANPGSCSGVCNVHDPGLIQRDDGIYFRFSTGNKISYAQSSSIEGPWTAVGSVVPDGSSINKAGNDDLWVCRSACLFLRLLFSILRLPGLSQGVVWVHRYLGFKLTAVSLNNIRHLMFKMSTAFTMFTIQFPLPARKTLQSD